MDGITPAAAVTPRQPASVSNRIAGIRSNMVSPRTFASKRVQAAARPPVPGAAMAVPALPIQVPIGSAAVASTAQGIPDINPDVPALVHDAEFITVDASKFPLEQYVNPAR